LSIRLEEHLEEDNKADKDGLALVHLVKLQRMELFIYLSLFNASRQPLFFCVVFNSEGARGSACYRSIQFSENVENCGKGLSRILHSQRFSDELRLLHEDESGGHPRKSNLGCTQCLV